MITRITYSMNVSLDGFVNDAAGSLEWALVDEEIHKWWNDETSRAGAFGYGRRLYELMAAYWPTAASDPDATPAMVEFANIWNSKPILVFSKSLVSVRGNARLAGGSVSTELARHLDLDGELQIGGANLASQFIERGLVDEYGPMVHPVTLGSGTPFFPPSMLRTNLRLVETHEFKNGAIFLRYERVVR